MNELLDYLMPHYKCGWNDTQYGTVDFPSNSKDWGSVDEWIRGMKSLAESLWNEQFWSRKIVINRLAYLAGCIACCEQFLKDGKVDRI